MADYTLKHTGLQIDEALTSALDVKRVRGIVKMTDSGPAAAVPGVDYPDSSGSTVDVTGILKGVRNAETGEIEIQQAAAGTDYQTPLTAGVDYASPSAVSNKQNKVQIADCTIAADAWTGTRNDPIWLDIQALAEVSGVTLGPEINCIIVPKPESAAAYYNYAVTCVGTVLDESTGTYKLKFTIDHNPWGYPLPKVAMHLTIVLF